MNVTGLDIGELVGLTIVDLKKAFGTDEHDILCKELEYYGIQQRELAWFKSYLLTGNNFQGLMV